MALTITVTGVPGFKFRLSADARVIAATIAPEVEGVTRVAIWIFAAMIVAVRTTGR